MEFSKLHQACARWALGKDDEGNAKLYDVIAYPFTVTDDKGREFEICVHKCLDGSGYWVCSDLQLSGLQITIIPQKTRKAALADFKRAGMSGVAVDCLKLMVKPENVNHKLYTRYQELVAEAMEGIE